MNDEITIARLLKAKFDGDKVKAQKFLESHQLATWQALVESDDKVKEVILRKLESEREYVTYETDTHVISRPKDIRSVSEMSFSIKGHKLK